ncbi:hypothetical protein P3L51_31610 [Streptomyces sp. PSRA5]|uniref:hypothetical protein n=1 Tax=Streptomyces panacea TaxID=3035064 RepID=UPI00339D08DD
MIARTRIPLDALRLGPPDDVAEVTAAQVRRVVTDLIETGRRKPGDRDILVVFDAVPAIGSRRAMPERSN